MLFVRILFYIDMDFVCKIVEMNKWIHSRNVRLLDLLVVKCKHKTLKD